MKQNSDVVLDLFWLIFRLPKTLVLFLHTTKVPEATREKSAPNKQTIVLGRGTFSEAAVLRLVVGAMGAGVGPTRRAGWGPGF